MNDDSTSFSERTQPAATRPGPTASFPAARRTIGDTHVRIDEKAEAAAQPAEETTVEARTGWPALELGSVWRFRELMYELARRDIAVRYKQTIFGAAWAVIKPTMMMVVFTFFLGRFARFSTGDVPGPIFFYAGFLPWTLFSTGLAQSGNSVVGSVNLITKIYFPRLIVPFAAMGPPIIDFVIALGVLGLLMAYYGIAPSIQMVFFPLAVAVMISAALAGGLFLAAFNVSYRDFRYVIPFMVQIWMFSTPAIFMDVTELTAPPAEKAAAAAADRPDPNAKGYEKIRVDPKKKVKSASTTTRFLLAANPMNGIISFFRASMLGTPLPWTSFGVSAGIVFSILTVGLYYFRRVEDTFADVI